MSGVIANNFGSLPVVFDHGEGARLFDTEGKEYIDFVAGIGVNCLGHTLPYSGRQPVKFIFLIITIQKKGYFLQRNY